jgi:hypothetical protein
MIQKYFATTWNKAATVPVFERCKGAVESNGRLVSILDSPSTLSDFIINDHVLNEVKLNPNEHGFAKSTITNLVTASDLTIPVVRGQRQADPVYFDL